MRWYAPIPPWRHFSPGGQPLGCGAVRRWSTWSTDTFFDDATPLLKKSILLAAERLTAPQTDLLLTMNQWDFDAARRYRLGARVEGIPGIGVDFSAFSALTPEARRLAGRPAALRRRAAAALWG